MFLGWGRNLLKSKDSFWPYSPLKSTIFIALLVMVVARLFVLQIKPWPVAPTLEAMISLDYVNIKSGESCKNPQGESEFRHAIESKNPTIAWLVSPGYWALGLFACRNGEIDTSRLVKWNQWFTIATAIMGCILLRFLASSWLLGLFAAFSILTKSSILARQGLLAVDAPMMFFIMSWFCSFAHYVRTGSFFAVALGFLFYTLAVFFDRSALVLGLCIPVLLVGAWTLRRLLAESVVTRLKAAELDELQALPLQVERRHLFSRAFDNLIPTVNYSWDLASRIKSGGVFSTLRVPFAYWAYYRKRWLRISLAWLALALGLSLVISQLEWQIFGVPRERLKLDVIEPLLAMIQLKGPGLHVLWLVEVLEPLDFKLLCALSIVMLCALRSPAEGLPGFIEVSLLFLLVLVGFFFTAWVCDSLDASLFRSISSNGGLRDMQYHIPIRRFFGWVEPTLITLGVGGVYNLIMVASHRTGKERKS